MVSPPDKNGGDVIADGQRTRVAIDGDTASFSSLTGFGDALGMGVSAEYMSTRDAVPGTSGWSTHSLLPQVEPVSVNGAIAGLGTFYQAEFSDDLSTGILRTLTNLSGDPNLDPVTNLYLREDLLIPGAGSYQLLTACALCTAPLVLPFTGPNPTVVGTTPDFGHVIFESKFQLSADAPTQPAGCLSDGLGCRPLLYEWDHGTLRYVGILPDSEGGGAAIRSIAGTGPSGGRYTLRTLSQDGSRIFFTVPPGNGAGSGPLYMRENHATTVRISASERTDCAGDPSCGGDNIPDPAPDPGGEQPAEFQISNLDGSTVLFKTSEQLTDEDSNGSPDLYAYDTTLPAGAANLTRLSVDSEPADGTEAPVNGVLGASENGSYVYFTASGQLVAGEPSPSGTGIYVWHAGALDYVGAFADTTDVGTNQVTRSFGSGQLEARVTPDGRHLLFTARDGSGLTGYDQLTSCDQGAGGCIEVYLYSADADELVCASCNPSGAGATTSASFTLGTGLNAASPTSHLPHPISDDGSRVFFTSGEKLVAEDQNGKRDAYEYRSADSSLHLLSSGRSSDDSYFLDASPNGDDALLATRERLVGWDRDNGNDLYDARVGGGFPDPPAPPSECVGDACQGAANAPAPISSPRSSSIKGNDNVRKARTKCGKGKVRKRIHGRAKCVKKHKGHKHKRSRAQRRTR
jgi:hypothetical protein